MQSAIDVAETSSSVGLLIGARLPGRGPEVLPEPLPSQRVRVAFAGPGSGRAPLTWGQRDIWATMVRQRNWLPQGGRRPLADGTRLEDVAAELAYLHGRYQAMRTRLVFDDDGAGDRNRNDDSSSSPVSQWVTPAGETFLDVYDTPPGENPDGLAARVEAVYRHRPYDLREELPVRMAVVRAGGVCAQLVVLMHHLALDAGGAAVMIREVTARERAEPRGMQPLEQAAWQTSEAGRRHGDRTLRYVAKSLDRLAAGPPPTVRTGPRSSRYWSGRLVSQALGGAVATVAARCAVDEAAVLTAVTATAFARLTNTDRVLMRPRVGNRFRPALADAVCFVAQSGLLVLELGDTTFDQLVDRARGATMAAVKNAYFNPDALQAILSRFEMDHGDRLAIHFNDRHAAQTPVAYTTADAPNPREAPRTHGTSTFAWLHRGSEYDEPLSVTIDPAAANTDTTTTTKSEATDRPDAAPTPLSVSLHFDTHRIAPEAVEELAWGIERAAIEAAAAGDAPTGIPRE